MTQFVALGVRSVYMGGKQPMSVYFRMFIKILVLKRPEVYPKNNPLKRVDRGQLQETKPYNF